MTGTAPSVFTIPPHRGFADALVAGLLAHAGGDAMSLARGIILLPNNRAVRAVTDAFVRRAAAGLLLPRLVAIGDPELGEALGGLLDPADGDPVPPAMEPMARLMILSRLVSEARVLAGQPVTMAEAVRLAAELARTLDQLIVDEIDPVRLTRLIDPVVEPNLAAHWQRSLSTLELILSRWPAELERRGRIDLADRRNRLLDRASRRWRENPPAGLVVAAGITSSAPAVARLLKVVASMAGGMVVLPGLDLAMPQAAWDALGPHDPDPETGHRPRSIETHPQYHLKLLLDRMGVGRGEVRTWRRGGGHDAPAARTRAIGHAMTPAAFTGGWAKLKPADRRLTGVRATELDGPAEEAQAIAIALREAIDQPGRTAALITPDRALARRVSAHLRRWGIDADDSAGRPLSATPGGSLLLALAEAAAERFAPVPLLALLKHPLVRADDGRIEWLDGARRLDLALRGPRPAAGLAGIARHLEDGDERETRLRAPARGWWAEAAALLTPLEAAFADDASTPATMIATLRDVAYRLAGDRAWAGPDGRAAADLVTALEDNLKDGPALATADDVHRVLRLLMDQQAVRPPQGGHPRISIWGLIEAQLQQADLLILGGLNEGTWPAPPAPDPWLAPAMRAALGLPGLDRRIGLVSHDFANSLGAPQVLVTRARRDARAPAIASRLWLRLEAMTGGITRAPRLKGWARALDRPAGPSRPVDRPAPSPPVADRPRRIAVTRLDRLKADPFAFYADAMLGLSRLDAIDADPGPAWRGSAVHRILDAWLRGDGCDPATLLPRARAMLDETAAHPVLRALWTPRLLEAVDWIGRSVAANRLAGRTPVASEIRGEADMAGIRLYGTADRIDQLPDGSLAIVDYKTGQPPNSAQVAAGYALQLGLLGLIAERGGFAALGGKASVFEYWSLAAKAGELGHVASPVTGRAAKIAPEDFTGLAAATFAQAAAHWLTGDAPFVAKLHPEYAPYADYDQLMRLDEWFGRGDGAAEEEG